MHSEITRPLGGTSTPERASRRRGLSRATAAPSLLLTLALLELACVSSYAGKPPLTFDDIRYDSLDGVPWPIRSLTLQDVPARYGMKGEPRVAYVELNPEGAPTLLFIHGLGANAKWWRYQLDEFAGHGYRVLAVDLLGFGKSEKPASFPYTIDAMADVVAEFIRRLDLPAPILVGHSMGGHVSLSLAIRFPELVGELVLTQPAGLEEYTEREKAWFRNVYTTDALENRSEYLVWGSYRYTSFARWNDDLAWVVEEPVRLAKNTAMFDQHLYAVVKSIHGLAHTDFVRANLDKIEVPTLIVYGDQDRLIPNPYLHGGSTRAVMRYGHTRIRGSELHELEGCGHAVQMDCREAYNTTLLDWLTGR